MNRRSFLRNLVLGAAALPVAVKAVSALEPRGKQWQMKNAQRFFGEIEWSHNPAWEHAQYDVRFLCHRIDQERVSRIAQKMSGQKPYTHGQLMNAGMEWHRGQTVRT